MPTARNYFVVLEIGSVSRESHQSDPHGHTVLRNKKCSSMRDAQISVLSGHAGVTIFPPFSQYPVEQLIPVDPI